MMNVQGLWFALILVLLLLSLCLPGAFLAAIVVFYVPILGGLLLTIAQIIGPLCFSMVVLIYGLFLV
jgi:hypothetical protein